MPPRRSERVRSRAAADAERPQATTDSAVSPPSSIDNDEDSSAGPSDAAIGYLHDHDAFVSGHFQSGTPNFVDHNLASPSTAPQLQGAVAQEGPHERAEDVDFYNSGEEEMQIGEEEDDFFQSQENHDEGRDSSCDDRFVDTDGRDSLDDGEEFDEE